MACLINTVTPSISLRSFAASDLVFCIREEVNDDIHFIFRKISLGQQDETVVKAYNSAIAKKEEISLLHENAMTVRCDTEVLPHEMVAHLTESMVVIKLMERLILINAPVAMNQKEYNKPFSEYEAHNNAIKEKNISLKLSVPYAM